MFAERQHRLTRPEWRLIDTKLTAPAAPSGMVPKEALVEALCAPEAPRLLLLRAPAGFGKTTLMLQCRERFELLGVATAWLTLDASDNDTARLLAGLEAAAVYWHTTDVIWLILFPFFYVWR